MIRTITIRGPASYAAGGFNVTLGEMERIGSSSGRQVQATVVSSSPYVANVVGSSGNITTVLLRDLRSGGLEAAAAVDVSNLHVMVTAEGL